MKNLWIIPIVVLSVFACSETKEKPLTPIYADAFYEPDFIPYLMLKHGVDTIKKITTEDIGINFSEFKKGQSVEWHSFNKERLIYKHSSVGSIDDAVWFNKDSLIWIQQNGGSDVVDYFEYGYNRFNDTICQFLVTNKFSIPKNDSLYYFEPIEILKQKIDSLKGTLFIFQKKQLLSIKDYFTTSYSRDSKKRIILSYQPKTESGIEYGYFKKEYSYINDSCFNVKEYFLDKTISSSNKPIITVKEFINYLPFKEYRFVDDTISFEFQYQIIRNAKN